MHNAWLNKSKEDRDRWEKISASHLPHFKGKDHPLYGIGHTEEAKKKMSNIRKAYWQNLSEEEKEKIRNAHKGTTNGAKNGRAKKVKCIETGEIFEYILKAVEKYPKASKIAEVCNGTRKTAGGLHWEWA